MTSSPELEEPVQTRPVLVAETAVPDLREIQVIEPLQVRRFSAEVVSAEDLGQDIRVRMYVDYGVESFDGSPHQRVLRGAEVPPASTGQPRVAQVNVNWEALTPGCHTLTLIVSHAFDEVTECPEVLDDSSQLTWHVLVCDVTGPCPPSIADPRFDCPEATKVCPEIADEALLGSGGGGGAGP